MKTKLIYIATPYTGNESYGVQLQMHTMHYLLDLDQGVIPYAPLLCHYAEIYSPRPYEEWLNLCLNMVPRCDAVLAMHGFSYGVNRELEVAREFRIPTLHSTESLLGWLNQVGKG